MDADTAEQIDDLDDDYWWQEYAAEQERYAFACEPCGGCGAIICICDAMNFLRVPE